MRASRTRCSTARSRTTSGPLLLEETAAPSADDDLGVFYTSHRIMDAWKISDNVKTIALNPKSSGILRELYGRKPLPFQTLNFPFGTQQAAHSDTIHFNSKPPGYMAGVWVALEDMDMDNGPLVYYPGSQKLPEVTMQDVGVEADYSELPALRAVHRRPDRARGPRARVRHDQEGPGPDLVGEPPARRLAAARTRTVPPQPGDPLLLRGLPLLHADDLAGPLLRGGRVLARSRLDPPRALRAARARWARGRGRARETASRDPAPPLRA